MENLLYNFSVYKAPVKNTIPFKTVSLNDVYKVIISDKYKALTNDYRQITDKATQNEIKALKLDYVTFSGIFNQRAINGLVQHSNLFCIDLDNLNNVAEVKTQVKEKLTPSLMFVSPSGKGLKIVYKINTKQAEHLRYYKAFEQFFKQQMNIIIDEKCKDIPRACFLCYDCEAYFNDEATIIDISFIDTYYNEVEILKEHTLEKETLTDYNAIINNLKIWLDKKESFINGNRNNYITQLASAYNRYGIPQNLAESDLFAYAESDFKETEIKSTIRSIYNQKQWHNTATFEINQPYLFSDNKVEVKQIEIEPIPLLPIEGFPEYVQCFINEYVSVYSCPRDYIAASVLFSTAFAIGNKLELIGKYNNAPVLWLAIVGNVSTGKTEPLNTCLSYFNKIDSEAYKHYQLEKNLYQAEKEKPKNERDTSLQPPFWFQYILNDYTPEALARVHSINNRGVCVYRDELKGWLDDFGRYSKSGEQSNMLSSFFRLPMKFNRAGNEPINIDTPCIFVSGGIQPDLLPTLANDSRAESGFLSRFLFAFPDLQIKQNYSKNKLNSDTLSNYHKYLGALATIKEVVNITLSENAETIYANWFNENAKKTNDETTGYLKGVYGKLDVYALRFAIIIHGMELLCNQNTETEISEKTMQTAIEITEYFRATALKVYCKIFTDSGNINLNKKDLIKYLSKNGASQNEIATVLKVSQQYVQKVVNK